jgi:hypothetical protein
MDADSNLCDLNLNHISTPNALVVTNDDNVIFIRLVLKIAATSSRFYLAKSRKRSTLGKRG